MGKLAGKTAIITGGSKGIGRGIVLAFVQSGCDLLISARNEQDLDAMADEARSAAKHDLRIITHAGDIGCHDNVTAMFAKFNDNFEKLDLLVNNAGAFNGGPLDQCSLEDWDHVINTNLRGPFMCTQQAFQIMKPQGVGRIINVGSISATRVRHSSAPYSTSKFGLAGLTQVTALEGRDYGITCCGLQPGNIETERRAASSSDADQEPMMSVHDIAEVALLMATLPPHVEMLDAVVLPSQQLYVGRG